MSISRRGTLFALTALTTTARARPAQSAAKRVGLLVASPGSDLQALSQETDPSLCFSNPPSLDPVKVVVAGNYRVCVLAWGGTSMTHALNSWVVTTADASSSLKKCPSQS
jgi:hypothetical protein